jgi:hypothetical protein
MEFPMDEVTTQDHAVALTSPLVTAVGILHRRRPRCHYILSAHETTITLERYHSADACNEPGRGCMGFHAPT